MSQDERYAASNVSCLKAFDLLDVLGPQKTYLLNLSQIPCGRTSGFIHRYVVKKNVGVVYFNN